jgi:hypothetical protein
MTFMVASTKLYVSDILYPPCWIDLDFGNPSDSKTVIGKSGASSAGLSLNLSVIAVLSIAEYSGNIPDHLEIFMLPVRLKRRWKELASSIEYGI